MYKDCAGGKTLFGESIRAAAAVCFHTYALRGTETYRRFLSREYRSGLELFVIVSTGYHS
jgi:hypothetical protein